MLYSEDTTQATPGGEKPAVEESDFNGPDKLTFNKRWLNYKGRSLLSSEMRVYIFEEIDTPKTLEDFLSSRRVAQELYSALSKGVAADISKKFEVLMVQRFPQALKVKKKALDYDGELEAVAKKYGLKRGSSAPLVLPEIEGESGPVERARVQQ